MDPLSFRCTCGAEPSAPEFPAHSCAAGYGNGCAEWHETRESAEAPGFGPALLKATPQPGDIVWLRVRFPFAGATGQVVTILFEPPMIALNGLDGSSIDDIRSIALVTGRIEAATRRDDHSAIALFKVTALLAIPGIVASPRQRNLEILSEEHFALQNHFCESVGPFTRFEASLEGDAGTWALCLDMGNGHELLVYRMWDDHYDHVVVGPWSAPGFLEASRFRP